MIRKAEYYANELHAMQISEDVLGQTEDLFDDIPAMKMELENPTIDLERKHSIIDKVFPEQIRDFLKILTDNDAVSMFTDVAAVYRKSREKDADLFVVKLIYVTPPNDKQVEGILNFINQKYDTRNMKFDMLKDESIGGGFILRAGNDEYDWSTHGRINELKALVDAKKRNPDNSDKGIISILKEELEDFDLAASNREIGFVSWVGDGIAYIDGIDHAVYGEIIIFDSGVKGMVMDIKRDRIGCILFGNEDNIMEGSRAARTMARAGVPVGDALRGRVVNALGMPIDGLGEMKTTETRPIEEPAPGIVDRLSVSVPMETGILAIDSMFPIGRGQRELIIGDRQTGKTSIAIDTIINQRGKDVICIYVAIGQKASTVAKIVGTLKKNDAMDYTIVVSATASEPAPLQYIAPYSGTAMAEYFMHAGKDVLIVYDDLSKHAVAYRAISLLLERPPGREAYPGDVFYLHSRLLERSSRLSKELGGGSITALPIIETQEGDVSAYIPTNVISITDGQIFLESDLFFEGQRPAVNVGLSVSRVGGAAQTKAMKKAAGSIRIDLAQFREMEVFTQFSSDLDPATKDLLAHGHALMEILKQHLCRPLSLAEQVISLIAANSKLLLDIPVADVKDFQIAMLENMKNDHSEIISQITIKREVSDDLKEQILKSVEEFKAQWQEQKKLKTV
jgi:F-type H+-transporting ATPase subunit alpha